MRKARYHFFTRLSTFLGCGQLACRNTLRLFIVGLATLSYILMWLLSGSTMAAHAAANSANALSLPPIVGSHAIAVRSSNPDGEADVVAQGPNNSLLYYYATPGSHWSFTQIA